MNLASIWIDQYKFVNSELIWECWSTHDCSRGEKIGTFYISYGLTLKIHALIYSYLDYNIHFVNFWGFTPCTGGLKMLKMLKNLNFQTYGRKGIYSLKCSSRGVEGYYIYIFRPNPVWPLWLQCIPSSVLCPLSVCGKKFVSQENPPQKFQEF